MTSVKAFKKEKEFSACEGLDGTFHTEQQPYKISNTELKAVSQICSNTSRSKQTPVNLWFLLKSQLTSCPPAAFLSLYYGILQYLPGMSVETVFCLQTVPCSHLM